MKLVAGRSLADLLAKGDSIDERLALLPHVIAVADAIAYSHDRKIIHRDLKPSNIIVGEFGETIVIDWGLAKDLTDSVKDEPSDLEGGPFRTESAVDGVTATGAILGTPAYMAPEQALGQPVDERADVYAIGAILYTLLSRVSSLGSSTTSHPVFASDCLEQARPLREWLPALPIDLVAIVEKAMAGTPGRRYATARGLAEDLRRFQAGQLVGAHHYPFAQLFGRWLRRHRTLVVSLAAFLAAVVASALFSVNRIRQERDHANKAYDEARTKAGELLLAQARSLLDRDPTAAMRLLEQFEGRDMDTAVALAANAVALGVALDEHQAHNGQIMSLNYLPDGRIVTSGLDGTIRLWDRSRGIDETLMTDVEDTPDVSADGRLLAYARAATVGVLDINERQPHILGEHEGKVSRVVIAPSGRVVISGSADGIIRLWNVDGTPGQTFRVRRGPVEWIALSPDERFVAATSYGRDAEIWAVSSGHLVGRWLAAESSRIGFSPESRFAVWSAATGKASLLDLARGRIHELDTDASRAGPFAISPQDRYLLAGTSNGEILAWELPHRTLIHRRHLHDQPYALGFSRDAMQLAYSDSEALHVLTIQGNELRVFHGHDAIWTLAFSPDDQFVATAGLRRAVRLWQPRRGIRIIGKLEGFATKLAFSNSGVLACGGYGGSVAVWDIHTGTERRLQGAAETITDIDFSRDNTRVVAATEAGIVHVWELTTGHHVALIEHKGAVRDIALSRDGTMLASASDDRTVRVWSFPGDHIRNVFQHEAAVYSVAFTTAGDLVSVDASGGLWSWRLSDGTREERGRHRGSLEWVSISATGTIATSGGLNGAVYLWSPKSSIPLHLDVNGQGRAALGFSPLGAFASAGTDGRLIAADASLDRRVKFSDIYPFTRVALSPSENLVAGGTDHGSVDLFERSTGRRTIYQTSKAATQDLMFSPQSDQLAVALADGTVALVPAAFDWTVPETHRLREWIPQQIRPSNRSPVRKEIGP